MKKLFSFLLPALLSQSVLAQLKLGGAQTPAQASAILEMESTSRGVLLPRMTTAERNAIASPAEGLLIYNTTSGAIETYDGTAWDYVGNTPTVPAAPASGSTFTSGHGSNATPFNTNTACTGKLISAGYTRITCSGYVAASGDIYPLVYINGQCWLRRNLNAAPSNYPYDNSWKNTTIADLGRWGYYNGTTNGTLGFYATEAADNYDKPGLLYQWSAAMNGSTAERSQGACPAGWHVPSDCEWMYLEHGLGMTVANQATTGWRSAANVGQQLRGSLTGNSPYQGTDTKLFTAILRGYRQNNGVFAGHNTDTYYWTSTENNATQSFSRSLSSTQNGMNRTQTSLKANAYSLRCIAD